VGHSILAYTDMKKNNNQEIIQEMAQLFEKMAVDSFAPVITEATEDHTEAVLISLKAINARYDKHEAIVHVQALMDKYNIQIDELLEQINH
jgi:hypothetical protein